MRLLKYLVIAIFALMASPALAATESEDLCSLEQTELLQALDGTWSVKQGPTRVGGAATVPHKYGEGATPGFAAMALPAQPAVRLKMSFVPEQGYSLLTGQGQQMIIVPAGPSEAAAEIQAQRARDGSTADRAQNACSDAGNPAIVGTNRYRLVESEEIARIMGIEAGGVELGTICSNDPLYELLTRYRFPNSPISGEDMGRATEDACRRGPEPDGDMQMTIVAQFESANFGEGHLYFSGEMNGAYFGAVAPITLTR